MVFKATSYEIEQWSSYKRPFDEIFKLGEVDQMLEIGAGILSTPYFAYKVNHLDSIETNPEWFKLMDMYLKAVECFRYPGILLPQMHLIETEKGIFKYLEENHKRLQVVFIDHAINREGTAEKCMELKIPVIAMHDFNNNNINYSSDYVLFHNGKRHYNPTLFMIHESQDHTAIKEAIDKSKLVLE